jgi:biotin carboxyl carrier protein
MREIIINNEKVSYDLVRQADGSLLIRLGEESFTIGSWEKSNLKALKRVIVQGKNINLWKAGEWTSFADTLVQVKSTREQSRNKKGSAEQGGMISPMPGKILKVMVKVGQSVKAGEGLLVMEAMKMEHTIKANADGVVEEIHCEAGKLVDGGVELVSLASEEA